MNHCNFQNVEVFVLQSQCYGTLNIRLNNMLNMLQLEQVDIGREITEVSYDSFFLLPVCLIVCSCTNELTAESSTCLVDGQIVICMVTKWTYIDLRI